MAVERLRFFSKEPKQKGKKIREVSALNIDRHSMLNGNLLYSENETRAANLVQNSSSQYQEKRKQASLNQRLDIVSLMGSMKDWAMSIFLLALSSLRP